MTSIAVLVIQTMSLPCKNSRRKGEVPKSFVGPDQRLDVFVRLNQIVLGSKIALPRHTSVSRFVLCERQGHC